MHGVERFCHSNPRAHTTRCVKEKGKVEIKYKYQHIVRINIDLDKWEAETFINLRRNGSIFELKCTSEQWEIDTEKYECVCVRVQMTENTSFMSKVNKPINESIAIYSCTTQHIIRIVEGIRSICNKYAIYSIPMCCFNEYFLCFSSE